MIRQRILEKVLETSLELDNKVMYGYGLNSICKYYFEVKNFPEFKNKFKEFEKFVLDNNLTQFNKDLKKQRKNLNELQSTK